MHSQAVPRIRSYAWLSAAFLGFLATPSSALAWTVTAPTGVTWKSLLADRSGRAITVGTWQSAGQQRFHLARYQVDGSLDWTHTPDGNGVTGDVRQAVLERSGDVFVAGCRGDSPERSGVLVARFDAMDGRLLWETTVTIPPGTPVAGAAEAIAIGPRGELVVGGWTESHDARRAFVSRLSPVDGSILWTWTATEAVVTSLELDRRGDVLATGTFFLAVKLQGTDGAQQWRVDSPGPEAAGQGYPQMRALALDRAGNLTVGGSLRDVINDTRSFYVARFAGRSGRRLAENAGPPRYSFESPSSLVAAGAKLYAAGRLTGSPVVARLRGTRCVPQWVRQPWALDDSPDRTMGVADLVLDRGTAFALGTDFPGRLLVAAYAASGKLRWQQDLGAGEGRQIAVARGRRLYVLGTRTGAEGPHSVLVGLDAISGTPLD